ncbi:hypothetical protein LJC60_03635 [Ruminococcaceae bacterium OttesenSCG-928-D13]|nr:hypothetical protein [Ruminococcaceae bacterium OttesenSCG-928-D13]
MKKILRAIIILLIPILLYYGLFLRFEPNNFFGLRAETPSGAVFGAIRQYRENPSASVIVGDSRTAHLDMDRVEQLTGRRFSNLAFGGASLKEELDLLDWLLKHYPEINEVVLGSSFYTMNAAYNFDRFSTIETALANPFAYLTSKSYNLEAMQNLIFWLQGEKLGGGQDETEDPANYKWADFTTPTGYEVSLRGEIGNYLEKIAPYTEKWEPNTKQYERLLELIDSCAEKGIRFVVVFPPMHPAVREYDVEARGIDAGMAPLLAGLAASPATLLDYELTSPPDFAEDQYFDGFHLDYQRGLPEWTEMLCEELR